MLLEKKSNYHPRALMGEVVRGEGWEDRVGGWGTGDLWATGRGTGGGGGGGRVRGVGERDRRGCGRRRQRIGLLPGQA